MAEPDLILALADLVVNTNEPEQNGTGRTASAATDRSAEAPQRDRAAADRTNEPSPPAASKLLFGAFTLFRKNASSTGLPNEPEPGQSGPPRSIAATALTGTPALQGAAVRDFGAELEDLLSDREPWRPSPLRPTIRTGGSFEPDGVATMLPEVPEDDGESLRQSVARAIQEDQLGVVRMPVVSLPQRRRRMVTMRLECRHAGAPMDPHQLVGGEPGRLLLAALDLELVRAAVKAAERPVPGSENLPVIIHLAASSFASETALGALSTLLGRRGSKAAVLQVALDCWPTDRAGLELVALLRRAQVVIGLDLNVRPHLSPDAIAARRLGLVCVAAAELHHASLGAYDGDLIQDIRAMHRSGVEVVVTGVGSERALAEVLDFPIHLGTGELFGRIG